MNKINITIKVENKKLPNIIKNPDMIKFEAKKRYKNISKEEKNKKIKYERESYYIPNLNQKLKQYQINYYASKK